MICIHIIDDNDALRESLASLITGWSEWRVTTWSSGSAFLEAAPRVEPGVLLLDQEMPGATGLDVLRSIARDSRFRVVMMTGLADIRLAVASMRTGAANFVEKPCDPAILRAALAEAAASVESRLPMLKARAHIARLAPRERDVLDGLVAGQANKMIAHLLGISPRTVEIYRANMMERLGADSLAAVIRMAFAAGLTPESSLPVALAA
jgi:two-component system response regulator FixJ